MIDVLETFAEKQAETAEQLPAFSGFKLLHTKRQLAELLKLIGRNGIFDEYTRHDISHIDKMLHMLDWIIPDNTKKLMTPADWLITVLSIYFHDLGMLVTNQEYESRNSSGFPEYCNEVLFKGDSGKDYQLKVEELKEKRERFLYQEFIRHIHAERIKYWILGQARDNLGVSSQVVTEIDILLKQLDIPFRRDLALICESHHLDDLDDFKKYKVAQPYGDTVKETANIHFAALLLRTVDLLHVTSDRTPSISFRLINPSDPISQQEWAKQMAVKSIRSQKGHDREGNIDENAPRDTIEVHAFFTKEDGFFGLTSYLNYANSQIQKTYDWGKEAAKTQGIKYEFPWRYIDDSNIQTEGFLRQTYEFTIDQAKILDLLTGHTLYNDTNVVLRELVQNSLDAVRLQKVIDQSARTGEPVGEVRIKWDSSTRNLIVEDNGTGMTQKIIERHLLKVGASRYQDSDFKKEFPGFSPISRFGIGILSAFMISDEVKITTCCPDEEQARQLELRSVHGKYLIRLLDKQSDEVPGTILPHGTVINLKIRPSADIKDLVQIAKNWIVLPEANVSIEINNNEPIKIGYSSPKEALSETLASFGNLAAGEGSGNSEIFRIDEFESGGVTLAYALKWNEFFREWEFQSFHLPRRDKEGKKEFHGGTCVEGIRVDTSTPGYQGTRFMALANVKGPNAPRTNVARSSLEATNELSSMHKKIYEMYCKHVENETQELYKNRSFSLTWATYESRILLNPIFAFEREAQPINRELLLEEVAKLPILIIEEGNKRKAASIKDLEDKPFFWTINCALFRSAENLLREVASDTSLADVIESFKLLSLKFPEGPVYCESRVFSSEFADNQIFENKEVDFINIFKDQRRVDLRWTSKGSTPRWINPIKIFKEKYGNEFFYLIERTHIRDPNSDHIVQRLFGAKIHIGLQGIEIKGNKKEIGIFSGKDLYLFPDSNPAKYIKPIIKDLPLNELAGNVFNIFFILAFCEKSYDSMELSGPLNEESFNKYLERSPFHALAKQNKVELDYSGLQNLFCNTNWKFFNPSAWERGKDKE